jgi:hypothetical protein
MTPRLLATALAALLGACCGTAQAACDTGLAERLHAKLHPKQALDHDLAVCEPWRGNPGRSIVVLPIPRPGSEEGARELDLDVLVVQQADNGNSERAAVVSRLFQPRALTEDAVRISEIRVDTARYRLAPDVRAFGLRVMHRNISRANPFSNETLTLYLPQGAKLNKVLDAFEMNFERGEWDTLCTGEFESRRSLLSIAKTTSNGLADLVVRRTDWDSRNVVQDEDCVERQRPPSSSSLTLHYDGSHYRPSPDRK